jgi:hypothetical protein
MSTSSGEDGQSMIEQYQPSHHNTRISISGTIAASKQQQERVVSGHANLTRGSPSSFYYFQSFF